MFGPTHGTAEQVLVFERKTDGDRMAAALIHQRDKKVA